jgi:hypothetical protein
LDNKEKGAVVNFRERGFFVTLAADWLTGKHAAGYFTPGLVFKVGPKVTGYTGYSIGDQNLSKGNHFLLLELGYNLN